MTLYRRSCKGCHFYGPLGIVTQIRHAKNITPHNSASIRGIQHFQFDSCASISLHLMGG